MAEGSATNVIEEIGRPLGYSETMTNYSIEHSVGIYYHAAVINTSLPLQDKDVIAACKILARRQEALQMRIVPTDQEQKDLLGFWFKPMDDLEKIDFESITMETKDTWPECVSRDHDNHKLDCVNGPLWRIILGRVERTNEVSSVEDLPHQYVIFIKIHHGIADGKSVFDILYQQFLPILSALLNGGDAENVVPFIPLSKSAEDLIMTRKQKDNPVPWYFKLGLDAWRWKNRTFGTGEKPFYKFPDETLPTLTENQTENPCFAHVFEKTIGKGVMKSAKENGVTVHSVLLAAGAVAFCRTAKAAGVKLPSSFKQGWPIDLRRHLKIETPQPLADLHGTGMTSHKRTTEPMTEEFWKHCKKIHKEVKGQNKIEKCAKFIGIGKYFVDLARKVPADQIMDEFGLYFYLSLSNLGNTSAGPDPKMTEGPMKIKLLEHFFTLTGMGKIDIISIGQMMVTFDDRMMWVVSYPRHRTSLRFVQEYMDNLQNVMETYCMSCSTDDQS